MALVYNFSQFKFYIYSLNLTQNQVQERLSVVVRDHQCLLRPKPHVLSMALPHVAKGLEGDLSGTALHLLTRGLM